MFSRFHRRVPSTPTSPFSDQLNSWDAAALSDKQQCQNDMRRPKSSGSAGSGVATTITITSRKSTTSTTATAMTTTSTTTTSSTPPSLPPIARVASVISVSTDDALTLRDKTADAREAAAPSLPASSACPDTQQPSYLPAAGSSPGFIGGVALANLRRTTVGGPSNMSAAAAAVATKTAASKPSVTMSLPASITGVGPGVVMTTTTTTITMTNALGTPERRLTRSKLPPPPINTGLASKHHFVSLQPVAADTKHSGRVTPSFVTPTDLQSSAAAAAASVTLSGNPSHDHHGNGNNSSNVHSTSTTRTKKGLPFLKKNPMSSLLGRRRTTHNIADVPYATENADVPVYAPIRGTKIHDFSAPRPKRTISNEAPQSMAAAAAIVATAASASALATTPASPLHDGISPPVPQPSLDRRPSHDGKDGYNRAVSQQPHNKGTPVPASLDSGTQLSASSSTKATAPLPTLQTLRENRQTLFGEKPLAKTPPPLPDSSLQEDTLVRGTSSTGTASTRSRSVSADVSSLLRPSSSTATTHSRNVSLSEISNTRVGGVPSTSTTTVASVVPRPMKSTSSRFSFMVGSASEEKMLEERHRKKQLEKQATQPDDPLDAMGTRDSRFDDFSEDFDYDAMMDDDGLEEKIPGVNADADEDEDYLYTEHLVGEEVLQTTEYGGNDYDAAGNHTVPIVVDDDPDGLDPNNDQENFAGFVFQRSNPVSSLVSPSSTGMMATPRDAFGRVIGFAMTDETSPGLLSPPSATVVSPPYAQDDADMASMPMKDCEDDLTVTTTGLGIDHLTPVGQQSQVSRQSLSGHDDLYFDQGLADELDFGGHEESATPFDESIFDNNDTDQYGRPIPGAFAKAKAQRAMAAAIEAASAKRDSDTSGQSLPAQSTARTSLSAGALAQAPDETRQAGIEQTKKEPTLQEERKRASGSGALLASAFSPAVPKEDSLSALRRQLPPIMTDAERVAAYQAALADAAYKAAASGKFRRDSSPPPMSTDLVPSVDAGAASNNVTSSPPPMPGLQMLQGPEGLSVPTHLAYAFTSQDEDDYQHDDYERGLDDDGFVQDMDDYDFDDDAIIAAANAEVLANDSDGFYGQEFNFYAAPLYHHGNGSGGGLTSSGSSSSAEYVNGGYFVPTGVGRSTSGRVVSREPNLTPITERSEYSNRNSVLSLALPPMLSGGEMRSPGLAQLALLDDGSDMSMDALKRLRTKTFGGAGGGSPVSLSSLESSPQSAAVDRDTALGHMPHHHIRRNSNSATSLAYPLRGGSGRTSEAGSDSGSPIVANSTGIPPLTTPSPMPPLGNGCFPPVQEEEDEVTTGQVGRQASNSPLNGSDLWMRNLDDSGDRHTSVITSPTMVASPTTMSALSPTSTTAPFHALSSPRSATSKGHRHKGSADSISYTMEEESGETRWVMERRRLSETGEMEILGREVVEGGRI